MATFSPEEVRMLGVGAPALLKMLRSREENLLNRIYGEFRNGRTDFISLLAEWATYRDQINDITRALRAADKE